uniref:WD repeat-containing protein 76 n=1 Tax=Anser brachyrhynchus TaxID=132585 RepID=A0A8B9BQ63_9AVES
MALSEPGSAVPGELSPLSQQREQVRGWGVPGGGGSGAVRRAAGGWRRGPLTVPRSSPQERTPTGGAEPRRGPEQGERRAGPGRQLRVLLTPLSVAGRRMPQKRLLGAYDGEEAAGKRLRAEPPGTPPGSPPSPAPAASPAGSGSEGGWDAESDGSDGGGAAQVSGGRPLSAYERKRLKNITENAKFFAALKLHEVCVDPSKKAEDETVRRRSMRLQKVEPSGAPVLELPAQPGAEEEYVRWGRVREACAYAQKHYKKGAIVKYQYSLNSMVLSEDNVKKVVKNRVCSVAIHPSESIIFVAAGDKYGQIGLWNVTEEGAHVFIPHNYSVNCMHFSPSNPAHLLSLSHDVLRCGDVTKAIFDEICRSEGSLSSFDFLEDNASTAIVGYWDGSVAVVDRRTPGTSLELSANIGFKITRTVHVHPVNKQYFVAAGSVDVRIYDVRYLKSDGNKPVSSLNGHTKSVASAYFSPVTGNRVVTVCADDKLRVYDTSSLSSTVAVLSTVRHNNNTGRWLTRFRAIWDPKQEDCFVVGSMARPRQIEVYQDTGKLLHSFYNVDYLGSVCSINVVHPSRNILVGGNSSGRLHVFKEQ